MLPAHAGMILNLNFLPILEYNVTRTRGDDPSSVTLWSSTFLCYPHTRGWSLFLPWSSNTVDMLPAHAGMILNERRIRGCFWHVTRTRGDDPKSETMKKVEQECYPHTRGWSAPPSWTILHFPMLPAHAGMILTLFLFSKYQSYVTRTRGDDPM